jgi:conjugative relaxase-like TrwC/TraI family protein
VLSIGKLATGQADYYLQQAGGRVDRTTSVASGVEDYYTGGPEAAGEWLGKGAAALGLSGRVGDRELRTVLEGRHPSTGVELRDSRGTRVPGFDLTFSAPKSVSVLFGVGGRPVRKQVQAAHEVAVSDALAYLEDVAAFGRRGHGGLEFMRGHGLVAAAFRHRTSRAGDPQLHTHVLIANLVKGEDGRWTAMDGRRVYTHAKTAGYLYEARLRAELTRSLGVQWTPVRNGIADIAGVPAAVLRAFSRRRVEIEAELKRRGTSSPAAAQAAALETRRAKDRVVDPSRLIPEWRRRAASLGLDEERIRSLFSAGRVVSVGDSELRRIAERLGGPEGLTKRWSTFSRRDVIRAWCEALPAGTPVTSESITRLADALLASELSVPLLQPGRYTQPGATIQRRDGRSVPALRDELRYSTPELLALEQRIIDATVHGENAGAGMAERAAIAAAVARRPYLSTEQREMVRRLTRDGSRIAAVVGKAGTGKTTALSAAREAWEASGHTVLGVAVARRAARELEESAGIQSTSLTALLLEVRRGGLFAIPPRAIVVVDEASMVSSRDLAELLDRVIAADGKVVLAGDHRQLPSVRAGGAFRAIVARTCPISLQENRRQQESWERGALDNLRIGRAADAIRVYEAHDRLVVGGDRAALMERLVEDWWKVARSTNAVMIALRRADVSELNLRGRERMRAAGALTGPDVELPSGGFAVGDAVVLRRNHGRLGVANGERGTLIAFNVEGGVDVRLQGRDVSLPRWYLDASARRPALQHAYAITGHIAQGMTVDQAFVLGSDGLFREWGYTALSRGRAYNRLYVTAPDDPEREEIAPSARDLPEARDSLLSALETSRSQTLAIDSARQTILRRSPSEQLRRRRAELRSVSGSLKSPTHDRWSRAREHVRVAEIALHQLAAVHAQLVARRPPVQRVVSRRRHGLAVDVAREREASATAELQRARHEETRLEADVRRETAAWVATHHEGLAELRMVEEELAHRKVLERRLESSAERTLSR